MAIDFTSPAVTQNYSSAYTAGIVANVLALGMMLDPTLVGSYTGLQTGVKRFNETTGIFERYNGTSWVAMSTGYLLDAGDTLTGILVTNNNVAHQWKDSGGTARTLLNLNASNNYLVGDSANVITSGQTILYANASIGFTINGTSLGSFTSGGFNTSVSHIQSASEAMRVTNSGGYLSGFNTANTTRTGYLQFNAAASVILAAENGAQLLFNTNGTTALTIGTSQSSVFAGSVTIPNNVGFYAKDTASTARMGILYDASNNWNFGDLGSEGGGSTILKAITNIYSVINGTSVGVFNSSGLSILTGQVYIGGSPEAVRIVTSSGYVSGWNTANTTRTGYLQFNSGSDVSLVADTNTLQFGTNSTVKAKLDTNGTLIANNGFGTTSYATNAQNPIWRFMNSTGYGLSYFQGTSGLNGTDSLGFHFGTATAAASVLDLNSSGSVTNGYALVGNITSSSWATGGRGTLEVGGSSTAIVGFRIGGGSTAYLYHDGTNFNLLNSVSSGSLSLYTNSVARVTVNPSGVTQFFGAALTNTNAIGTTSGAVTVDCSKSNLHTLTLNGNMTSLTLGSYSEGQTINVLITQDATGSRTWAGLTNANGWRWPAGVVPALSTTANSQDLLIVTITSSKFYASLVKGFA